jgi:hypothetical protein
MGAGRGREGGKGGGAVPLSLLCATILLLCHSRALAPASRSALGPSPALLHRLKCRLVVHVLLLLVVPGPVGVHAGGHAAVARVVQVEPMHRSSVRVAVVDQPAKLVEVEALGAQGGVHLVSQGSGFTGREARDGGSQGAEQRQRWLSKKNAFLALSPTHREAQARLNHLPSPIPLSPFHPLPEPHPPASPGWPD